MSSYFIYYTEASLVCVIIFAILLLRDLFSVDRQEKQIKYDHALIAFMLYFVSDALWAAVIAGILPRNRLTVVSVNFANCILMSAITYTWLRYAMAVEQIPRRNTNVTRLVVLSPFAASTAALVITYLVSPGSILNDDLELQPLYNIFLIGVPIIYIIAALTYTMKRMIAAEGFIEKKEHLRVGLFPLMVIIGGLLQVLVLPETPIFCFCSAILMLIFHIASMESQISTDPLTQLNNRGQLFRYTSQKANLYREDRLTVVTMFDINDFKQINDTYSHAEGDRALMLVAGAFRVVLKRHSTPLFLARYGGDEFILIVHPVDENEMEPLICEIREQIEEQCRAQNLPYVVSISAGFDRLGGESDTFQKCMLRADEKMYADKAKHKARRS